MNKRVMIGVAALLLACGGNKAPVIGNPIPAPAFDLSSADVVPGQILVDLKDNLSDSEVKDVADHYGLTFVESNEVAHQYRYEEATVENNDWERTLLRELKNDARVEHAEPIVKYHALFTPNDPLYKDQWGMTRIGLENSINMSCGMGVKVAVVDTGVACYKVDGEQSLTDLATCSGGFNAFDHDDIAFDRQAHGSHVSGTIAQLTNNGHGAAGIASCATIIPVKVLSDSGSGTNESVAEGIRWAADHADLMNLSLGGPFPSDVIEDAVNYAHDKGVAVICAAGNSGGAIGYPARFKNALAVSAIGPNDKIADFSSRGPEIAIAAPGVDIMQETIPDACGGTSPCFLAFSGTSMATPMVSGVAALLVSEGISNPDTLREKLQSTADPKKEHNLYGAGILRADNAVRSTLTSHLTLRLLALIGVILALGAAVKGQWKNRYSIAGIALGAFGAFPLFFSGLLPKMGSLRFIGEMLARPLGEMDMVFGSGIHSLMLFASAIPVVLVSLLTMQHPKLKLFAGGLGLGMIALDAQMAWSNDSHFMFGSLLMRAFMIVNIVVASFFVKTVFTTSATKTA